MSSDKTTAYPARSRSRRDQGTVPVVEILAGLRRGARLVLTSTNLVGKDPAAEVALDDPGVSRKHAKIMVTRDGGVTVVDLASTNGTFVNDTAVEIAPVRAGDRVRFGPEAELRLQYEADPNVPAAAPYLSPRQLQVARLVAEGLTSPQIAVRMSIKVRTVTSHLDAIYKRLGIGSRAALARVIGESGRPES